PVPPGRTSSPCASTARRPSGATVSQLIVPGPQSRPDGDLPLARTQNGVGLDEHIYQRLLKDRIIFLGSEVRDENANAICAQMLLLTAEDPDKDIYLYIN